MLSAILSSQVLQSQGYNTGDCFENFQMNDELSPQTRVFIGKQNTNTNNLKYIHRPDVH